jgi:hypothetical protein
MSPTKTEDNKDRTAADDYLEPRQYVAANLRDALSLVPDTGDWHGQLRHWCDAQGGIYKPNRCSDQVSYYQMRDERDALKARLRALELAALRLASSLGGEKINAATAQAIIDLNEAIK